MRSLITIRRICIMPVFRYSARSAATAYCIVACLVLFGCAKSDSDVDDSSTLESADARTRTSEDEPAARHVYYSHGVHNNVGCSPPSSCVYERDPDEPTDPLYPEWWISDWTMYRVFNNYDRYPPPYDSPPEGLTPADYEVSHGTTYYDATYLPADEDGTGAMMEHYEERCLPIFPMSNHFTCSFVSLGNKAYFLRYEDRPEGTPACCQFSLQNHPPRRDFIKHLPYNAAESTHLNGSLQAYSMRVDPEGANILFGYAFYKEPAPDHYDAATAPYRHPQSFYFSGAPTNPPDAPVVSQNYTNFRMERPDSDVIWSQVTRMCPADPPWCCLFPTDCPSDSTQPGRTKDWATMKPL